MALATATAAAAVLFWPGEDAPSQGSEACWSVLSKLDIEASRTIRDCGDALETAMTGEAPGHKPQEGTPRKLSKRNGEALELVITTYTDGAASAQVIPVPDEIKRNLANALAHYASDTYQILAGQVDYSDPAYSTSPNGIDIDASVMSDFLDALADDEDSFGLVRNAILSQIENELEDLEKPDFLSEPRDEPGKPYLDAALGTAISSGTTVGELRRARLNALTRQHENNDETAKEALSEDYETFGFPRLRKLFQDRSNELGTAETNMGRERLENLLSEAAEAYSRSTGFKDKVAGAGPAPQLGARRGVRTGVAPYDSFGEG
ncbi:hypothetical protein I3F58_24185 [Streptomyces sp. MUM 203J]|nr:hypothetical protein [Streptomyces sp. MUM 203J]